MKLHSRHVGAMLIVPAVVVAVVTGCSSSGSTPPAGPPPSSGSAAPQRTAQQVVADLTAKVKTAKPGRVVTAQSDPNKLLGRPGQYTSAALFTDSRVSKEDKSPDPLSSDNGGKVEVFASGDEAKSRYDYIQGLAKQSPLAAEYDYLSGTALVRVTKNLDPDAAKQYQDALG